MNQEYDSGIADYLYSTPVNDNDPVRGERIFQDLLSDCQNYYLCSKEAELLQNHCAALKDLLPCELSVIEFGPGSENSVLQKTLALLSALPGIDRYTAVDVNENYAAAAVKLVQQKFSGIKSGLIHDTCFNPDLNFRNYKNPIIICLGGLIFNNYLSPSGDSTHLIADYLRIWAGQLGAGGYLAISQDTNSDEKSLKDAYQNPWMAELIQNILWRVNRDLPIDGLNALSWKYQSSWNPENYRLDLGLVSTELQHLEFDDAIYQIKKGQYMHVVSSYKYPENVFLSAAANAGFISVKTFRQPDNPIVLHLLKVV